LILRKLFPSVAWESSRHDWGECLWEVFAKTKFSDPKVKKSSHVFRHFFISEQLEMGTNSRDVSRMVGASQAMIEKRYSHSVEIGLERVAAERRERFLRLGLNEHGDPLPQKEKETVN
jgi:site-specific recombinase XerD